MKREKEFRGRDLTGSEFGRLTVICFHSFSGSNRIGNWSCMCECGKNCIVRGDHLREGRVKSCGCFRRDRSRSLNLVHGHKTGRKTSGLYSSWSHMIQRCTNPKCKNFKNYGGRGITVCEEWRTFMGFAKDMARGWKQGLTIERKDVNLGYEPGNCCWIPNVEQPKNRTNTRRKP